MNDTYITSPNVTINNPMADLTPVLDKLDAVLRAIQSQSHIEEVLMSKIDDAITDLTSKVESQTTVDASAMALLNGLTTTVTQAIADAKAAGATEAQLATFTALGATLQANNQALADAVTANTPPPPPVA